MRYFLTTALSTTILLSLPLSVNATNPDEPVWKDGQGHVIRDGQGHCLLTIFGVNAVECGTKSVAAPPPPPVAMPPAAPPKAAEMTEPPLQAPQPAPKPAPQPEVKRKPITLRGDTSFRSGSSELSSAARSEIAEVAAKIKALSRVKSISIAGHTDSSGSDAVNQRLSEARAQAVRDVLIEDGIDGNVISATGYGESQPIADNSSAAGRASNRRVEIQIDGE